MDHEDPPRTMKLLRPNSEVVQPAYKRQSLRRSITHIGVGGFHRSHFARYIDQLCTMGIQDWGIVGAGVMPNDKAMAEALHKQDFLYTLISRDQTSTEVQVIGSIIDFINGFEDPDALIDQIAHPDTQIVSLTLTESGYPVDLTSGEFIRPEGKEDSKAFQTIVAGLKKRRESEAGPLTIMSFDNILENGQICQTATKGTAEILAPDLLPWMNRFVSFPNSMVDRITAKTTQEDIDWLEEKTGLVDTWPVKAEPFCQWVVEDNFAGDRLPLEKLDVIITGDVGPYEAMKLRLLNASHSAMAYMAALESVEHVDKAMEQPWINDYLAQFLKLEATPSLGDLAAIDLDDYCAQLLARFSNPEIGDQIERLCIDGSAKFRNFLLETIRFNLACDGPIDRSVFALAAWCEYLTDGIRHHGLGGASQHLAHDSNMEQVLKCAQASIEEPVQFLADNDTFESTFTSNSRFCSTFGRLLHAIRKDGVRRAGQDQLNIRVK